MKTARSYLLALCLLAALPGQAAETNALLELNKLSFFLGREYFILRSGRAQMLLQADRADPKNGVIGDEAENALLSRSMREPWRL